MEMNGEIEEDEFEVYEQVRHNEEDDEEDDEGRDGYETDGFIVDDVDEEEEEDRAESDKERQDKKKKKKRESQRTFLLDEDDYELLQESNISIPRVKFESVKFKRLRKARKDTEKYSSEFSDEEEFGRSAEERLKRSLFGDDEGEGLEDIAEENEQLEELDPDIKEGDEMADFIVDVDEVDEHGAPVRRKKPRKIRRTPGIPSSALQEARDIFGDVSDLLRLRKKSLRTWDQYEEPGEQKERRLEDQFEHVILSEKYMTERDDRIREIDIPERIQIYEESTGTLPTDDLSVAKEKDWIYNQLVSGVVPLFNGRGTTTEEVNNLSVIKDDIARFLMLVKVQKLDIPFIAMYRKEEILSLLKDSDQPGADVESLSDPKQKPRLRWHKVLWTILDLDKKWLLLQKRKSVLESYYNKCFEEKACRIDDEKQLNLNRKLSESIMKSLKAANSEREVDDVDSKFNLHFSVCEAASDKGQFKRPKRKSQYRICSEAGLREFASKFGYSSEQFGLLISLEKMRMDELEDAKETPEEMASNFTCAMFDSAQAVLRGARHMAAVEISSEPCVRKHVRSIFMNNAVVSTHPTPDGNAVIDSFHQFSGVKWLRNKPLTRFEDAQWLLIQKAEDEKLLQVSIKLLEPILDKLTSNCNDCYLSDGVSKSAQLWNEQRKQILQVALFDFLLPSMEKEARSLLTSRAKTWLMCNYGRTLWDKVSVSPFKRKENDVTSDKEDTPRVMACCWGPGQPATTFVMLDSSGEVLDVLSAGSLSIRGHGFNDQQRKINDQQQVQKFMMDHQPHVVVLGAVNLSCTRLKENIYEIIFRIVEHTPRDVGQEMDNLNIVYGDESLPRIYENSHISAEQFPGQEGIVRRAVALGRYLQNPLAMVATLCGPEREILSWKLSHFESFLTPDEKYGMVEQIMVDVTNQVGLDINLAASHEWLFGPLQFIAGLGPRKAASLQKSIVRAGAIFSRKELLTAHGLGKKVFVNAVGFLRVRRSGQTSSSSQFIDLLDDTRIHPESYGLAQELAKDIYMEDGDDDVSDYEDVLEMAIERVRENPHLLRTVDEYAEKKNHLNKKETLNDIRLELMEGFRDWRKPYVEPTQDDEFYMICGENEETLSEGRIVQATVRKVQAQTATCVLESGLTGLISKEDYTDDWSNVYELTQKLRAGDILNCKIKSIQKNRYLVFLTCKESEMRSNYFPNHRKMDPYYHERNSLHIELEKDWKEKKLARKHFQPRMIVHPHFQNITADEAMKFLFDKEPGESVFRPSSRGPSFLTLTLKIYEDVYLHRDINEGEKESNGITSLLQIGKTLKLGDNTFDDLDEIMDRYVEPLVAHLKAMLNYRKFKKGTKAEIDELLKIEKSEYPSRIVYCFGISHEHPGLIILTYVRSSNPHHEYIGLYPEGFKFQKKMFEDIDHLVAYFQRHIDDPHDFTQSIRSVAAMVPMRNGGSSSFSSVWGHLMNGGGWRGGQFMERDRTLGSRIGRAGYRDGGNQDRHGWQRHRQDGF